MPEPRGVEDLRPPVQYVALLRVAADIAKEEKVSFQMALKELAYICFFYDYEDSLKMRNSKIGGT